VKRTASVFAFVLLAACETVSHEVKPAIGSTDGQIALPGDYQSWPKFLSAVQRRDVQQVREIYLNPIGYETRAGDIYPPGSTFVMENWTVRIGPDGKPLASADGKMVKQRLANVFVMHKGPGNGAGVAQDLKTDDWIYGSFDDVGGRIAEQFDACRGCHVSHASKDYVWRYDEHFARRR